MDGKKTFQFRFDTLISIYATKSAPIAQPAEISHRSWSISKWLMQQTNRALFKICSKETPMQETEPLVPVEEDKTGVVEHISKNVTAVDV